MIEQEGIVPDPLDGLLQPPPPAPADDGLRRRLLDRTTRALRRRRRWRTLAWAAALAACYAAGVLTTFWLAPRRVEVVQVQPAPAPAPETQPAPVAPAATDVDATSAVALEWKAFDADKPRPDLYRQAGDRYMQEKADPESAVRCYGQSLDGASDKDLAISPDDDYLLMVVKAARQKEKNDAKKRG